MILTKPRVRVQDAFGSGVFGASRGGRKHRGTDYIAKYGDVVVSPISGRVTKLGFPYEDDLSYRYVQVTDEDGNAHRFFYVDPLTHLGKDIQAGHSQLGFVQNIAKLYDTSDKKMLNHVHYEIMRNGGYVDPNEFYK